MARFVSGLLLAVFALSFFGGAAWAGEVQWKITEKSGSVRIASPMVAAHDASVGEVLAPGATISTGGDGRAVISDGKTVITASSNSRLTTPSDTSDTMTRFIQDLGSVLFHVEKLPQQHFEVQAPLIAAVVKGTTFTVNASATENSVAVTEGLVQVTAANGGAQDFVPAGKTARVKAAAAKELKLSLNGSSTATSVKVAIGADKLNYAELTGGLVQTAAVAVPETTKATTTTSASDASTKGNETSAAASAGRSNASVEVSTQSVEVSVAAEASNGNANGSNNGNAVGLTTEVGSGNNGAAAVDAGVDVGLGNNGNGNGAGNNNSNGNGIGLTGDVGVGNNTTGTTVDVDLDVGVGNNGNGNGAGNSNSNGNGNGVSLDLTIDLTTPTDTGNNGNGNSDGNNGLHLGNKNKS